MDEFMSRKRRCLPRCSQLKGVPFVVGPILLMAALTAVVVVTMLMDGLQNLERVLVVGVGCLGALAFLTDVFVLFVLIPHCRKQPDTVMNAFATNTMMFVLFAVQLYALGIFLIVEVAICADVFLRNIRGNAIYFSVSCILLVIGLCWVAGSTVLFCGTFFTLDVTSVLVPMDVEDERKGLMENHIQSEFDRRHLMDEELGKKKWSAEDIGALIQRTVVDMQGNELSERMNELPDLGVEVDQSQMMAIDYSQQDNAFGDPVGSQVEIVHADGILES